MSLELPWPAQETADQRLGHDSYRLPVSPWREGRMEEIRAEGPIVTRAWRVMASGMTTLQILAPLREQLLAAGFEPLCECSDRDCGGFDFRFHAEILPEPEMHVDLGDFRYLAARRESPAGPEYVALVVSRSEETGFVQLTHIGGEAESPALTASTKSPDAASLQLPQAAPAEPGSLVDALMAQGRATLEDLRFATGASGLEGESFESLEALAAFLRADPSRRVMIVGHTDSQGSLEGNIALSRKRAQAVVDLLVSVYGVSPDQLSAEGVGYLSPRASNDTEEGRALNRRVEAVLQGQ
ncbi:MAG: OmpA family protein [Alphaproteobacteria bacterium]|nr:MAG: OmpA family protein [Alphaproteobacteria bacterium]